MAFVITGAIGLLFSVGWFFLYRSPNEHQWITDEEKKYIEEGQEKHLADAHQKPSVRSYSGSTQLLGPGNRPILG